ncbi:hypothetical protein HED55_11430 [Ochrobactrum haematophilum]|uniref:Uncharacterized protein n=1 Tax=Brucella haematophila TaxID=419474 RepID=A0ABX1DL29_9HYPH|nr:hypothetical protein [Brucella haematophila]
MVRFGESLPDVVRTKEKIDESPIRRRFVPAFGLKVNENGFHGLIFDNQLLGIVKFFFKLLKVLSLAVDALLAKVNGDGVLFCLYRDVASMRFSIWWLSTIRLPYVAVNKRRRNQSQRFVADSFQSRSIR